jgi:poly(3-hydroxybutyrate) depolymerase
MRFVLIFSFLFSTLSFADWETIEFEGTKVFVFIPKNRKRFSPLMLNLHGCGQKAQALVDHGNWKAAANSFKTIIAIPEVPGGGVIAGCWDYYGLNHTRSNRHNGFVLGLVEKLKKKFSIDKNKVFIAGLSSGGGESFVLACLAPDIFKGVGLNASPSVGTTSKEIARAVISIDQVVKNCNTLAGRRSRLLKNMKVSIIYGDNDYLVDRKYSAINAQAFNKLNGFSKLTSIDMSSLKGANTKGKGTLYGLSEDRGIISLIENSGLGHNWPAGQGGSSRNFISKNSINYPHYLLEFLLRD